MQNIGIVAEFNPFHSGHKHLIDTVKTKDSKIICVMSGNFVQRGDTAVFPKAERVTAALAGGVDMVVELPTPWAMSTAQNFAFGSVSILKSTGFVDKIAFGSECGDIASLINTAKLIESEEFNAKLGENLNTGSTFAKLRSDLAGEISPVYKEILTNPNDTLATEYISAASHLNFNCEFKAVKRIGAAHDSFDEDITVSASKLREDIKNGNFEAIKKYMPSNSFNAIKTVPVSNIKNIETAILADLRKKLSDKSLSKIADISEGLDNRFLKAVSNSVTLEELYQNLKTKRYTLARIRRIVLSAFLDIDNSFFNKQPPYIRVLGIREDALELLPQLVASATVPVICNVDDINKLDEFGLRVWELENTSTDLFSLSLNFPQRCGNEYYHKLIKGDF